MKPMFNYFSISLILLIIYSSPILGQTDSLIHDSLIVDSLSLSLPADSLNSIESQDQPIKFIPVDEPYWAIGTNIGRMIYQWSFDGPQEYNIFINLPWKKTIHWEIETGAGKNNINYSHLKYNTHSWFINVQFQYNLISASHQKDKDRFYLAPYIGYHQGRIEDAELYIKQTNFLLQENLASTSFYKATLGIKLGLEVEVFSNWLLSWQGQAGLLLAPNSFTEIKPNYIAGYGNADQNISFRFGFNVSYYFLVNKRK